MKWVSSAIVAILFLIAPVAIIHSPDRTGAAIAIPAMLFGAFILWQHRR
jgi:hypothetical protein